MTFLIAYDIADPSRLRRVARYLERRAVRCQKSVFLFHGDREQVIGVLEGLAPLLVEDQDVVQAWLLNPNQPANLVRGTPMPVQPGGVVLGEHLRLFVERRARGRREEENR
jgi:CRISPR-associated endonuclease Cas2